MPEALTKWFTYRVALGLVPIVLSFLSLALNDPALAKNLALVLSGGPLLLVGGALCGGALGELLSTPKRHPITRLICSGTCLLVYVVGAAFYATIAAKVQAKQALDSDFIVWVSAILYVIGVAAALGCVIIAENAKRYGAST